MSLKLSDGLIELKQIIAEGVATGASDVHLSPNHPPIFRIAGQLRTL